MKDIAEAQRAIEAAAATEPEKTAQEAEKSLGGRLIDEASGQLLADVIGALVRGAPEAAAGCAEAVAGAAGSVAGAVADGLGSL